MAYQAVVFDLDGTLLDTLIDIADSANAVLKQLGYPEHPVERYREFVGDGVMVLFQRSLPTEARSAENVERCQQGFTREYGLRWDRRTQAYRGVPELLESLTRRNVPLAVLSNKPDEFTKKCVARYFGSIPFRAIVGQRADTPRKPDPTSARKIAADCQLAPDQFLYVGDMPTDMQTARNAGMIPIGVAWGFRTADELHRAGAAAIINEPSALLHWFVAPS